MSVTVSLAPKQQQANERIAASRESGCDAYTAFVRPFEDSYFNGFAVYAAMLPVDACANERERKGWWAALDAEAEYDYHEAIGYPESRPSIQ